MVAIVTPEQAPDGQARALADPVVERAVERHLGAGVALERLEAGPMPSRSYGSSPIAAAPCSSTNAAIESADSPQ